MPSHHPLAIMNVPMTNVMQNIAESRRPITRTFIRVINQNAMEGNYEKESCAPRPNNDLNNKMKIKKNKSKEIISFIEYR
jgi:hypothetical protein